MHKKLIFLFFLLLFKLSGCLANTVNPSWSALTKIDCQGMHQAIAKNDPASKGYATPVFTAWYESGFKKALLMANQVNSYGGYQAVLTFYANGFQSEHLNVNPKQNASLIMWPGFIVAVRYHHYEVVYRNSESVPPLHAQLISCDHKSVETIMKKEVLPFTSNGYVAVKTTWSNYAPQLLIDTRNPWHPQAKKCLFLVNNKTQYYNLQWTIISKNQFKFIESAAYGPTPKFAMRAFGDKGLWISIPTFSPGEVTINNHVKNNLIHLAQHIKKYRSQAMIVFDLRGNGGGNASYAHAILRGLYGDDYLASLGQRFMLNRTWKAVLRVSKDNVSWLEKTNNKALTLAMQAALLKHQSMIEVTLQKSIKIKTQTMQNPVHAKIFLLTDGRCDSECWLFVRDFMTLPNVTLVGQPTHFMTPYTQSNSIALPSGYMIFNVPMQAFIQPMDHFNHPFIPSHIYHGDMGDTLALEKWIISIKMEIM